MSTQTHITTDIGSVVDFIDDRVRYRGLVVDIMAGVAHIVVIGEHWLHIKPIDDLVPVRPGIDFVHFSNPDYKKEG